MPAVAQDTRDKMVDIAKMSGSVTVPSFQLPTLPKQLQRITPACIALLVLFVLFSSQLGDFGSKVFVSRSTPFPRKIWQTWKVDPLDFEERDLNTARSWTRQNPSYRYEVLTDQNDQAWVENAFGPNGYNRLDIIYMYRELTAKIIKADILRYLVMYVEGGVYADIDVEDLRPIEHFVPERYQEGDVDMVLEWKLISRSSGIIPS